MIIDFNRYNGGGGSGSGVTPAQVQQQINSALTPYWESGETKDYVDGAVSGISLEGYATSGDMQSAFTLISETQSAITAVEDHLFDVEQVTASALTELHDGLLEVSGRTVDMSDYWTSAQTEEAITSKNYVTSAQAETQIVSKNYITSAETANFVTSAQVETQIEAKAAAYTPTSGFSTINGSAITNGGNIVIEGGADMSGYWNSAQTEEAISAATSGKADAANVSANTNTYLFPTWNEQGVITGAITNVITRQPVKAELGQFNVNGNTIRQLFGEAGNNKKISIYAPTTTGTTGQIAALSNSYTAVWVTPATINGSAITAGGNVYAPTTSGTAGDILVSTGNGAPVWATDNKVSSASVSTIWKGTQAQYDAITTKDPNTFYIIVSN